MSASLHDAELAAGLLTVAEYAAHRGVSRQAVDKALAAGRISVVGGGLIDCTCADAEWEANTGPPRGAGSRKGGGGKEYARARAEREGYNAARARLELARLEGEMVDAAGVQARAYEAWRRARDVFEALPARLGDRLALMADAGECRALLEGEIAAALGVVAEWARQPLPPP